MTRCPVAGSTQSAGGVYCCAVAIPGVPTLKSATVPNTFRIEDLIVVASFAARQFPVFVKEPAVRDMSDDAHLGLGTHPNIQHRIVAVAGQRRSRTRTGQTGIEDDVTPRVER